MNNSISSLIAAIEAKRDPHYSNRRIDWQRERNIALDDAIDLITKRLEGFVIVPVNWVEVAACPDECCDNGTVAHYSEGDAEISQCQFCYEKDQFLSTKGDEE